MEREAIPRQDKKRRAIDLVVRLTNKNRFDNEKMYRQQAIQKQVIDTTGGNDDEYLDEYVEDYLGESEPELNKVRSSDRDDKKYMVHTKNDKGNIVTVHFGDPDMRIRTSDPEARKNFRARHNCDNPGPKWKARYWSCKMWSTSSVSDHT